VIDHADALMLSNETATGMYPVESTAVMEHIIIETEKSVYDNLILADESKVRGKESKTSLDTIMSELARLLAERVDASFILAASITGDTGRMISRYRPELPIYVGTSSERVRRQLNLSWGVIPFLLPPCDSIEDLVNQSLAILKKTEKLNTGDKVVVVAGEPVGQSGNVNLLEVREVK
ncbi:MAG: pyruvate kinase alpha/beta domain-containing protein, partial [Patescibacteria group bacterium]